ncbi:putative RNA binding protein with dsRBD fold (UPF0201 family) [Methanohalophilus levihalophilus]|uniref:RNA-binding domain-containing protein n=1 Tax=Methanohalophilus levihalophilus TaxID=1431282 RepID=UPI001AE8DF49|nr:RNA-binding domain-containing protein [Methanohalophilus levihalophilus]MBP2030219.1 putative RNA binding protein with dsRBD fold (UPF0201 family) [Methanohalophilus levihalophilus]
MVTVEVWAELFPTEDMEKVKKAIGNVLTIDLEILDDNIRGEGKLDSLLKLHKMLRKEKILDSARIPMSANLEDNKTSFTFRLNKQAAYAGKASFPADAGVLGTIHVRVIDDSKAKLEEVIDWLAPPTEEGNPLFENPMPQN